MTTILMCAKCGGCAAYKDGPLCLFCEDGVPCKCQRKKKTTALLAPPSKLKPPKSRTAPAREKKKAEILSTLRPIVEVQPAVRLKAIIAPPVKLTGFAAHIERRMREHREWQEETTRQLVQDFANIALVMFQEMDRQRSRRLA